MQQEKIKASICWVITILYMAVIFWLSSRTADESSAQSGLILKWLIEHFGSGVLTDFIVRKAAHFAEYAGLAFLLNISLYQSERNMKLIESTMLASIYAISDEIHQIFVDGRSCQFKDWLLDTCGAITGTLAFVILFAFVMFIAKRKNTIDRNIN